MENNSTLKWIVYCTTNIVNKKIYIGVHKTNPNQYDYYIGNGVYTNNTATYERSKTYFQRAVKKYGVKSFVRNIIATFNNEEDAFNLEADIVNEEFLKRTDVYNIALGGKSGGSIIQCIPCYQYSIDGEFICEYKSYLDASKVIQRSLRSIQRAISDKTRCNNFYFTNVKYDKLDLTTMHNYEGITTIPVYQYDNNGKYECCYDSIKNAAKVLNLNDSCIGKAVKLGILYKNKYFSSVFSPEFSIAKHTQITSQEIHQYDLEGNYIASYKNMQDAKNKLGIKNNIYSAIKLNQLCGGFQWRFDKFDKIAPVKPTSGRARKVGKYDKDWNLIKEYKSLAECKRENGSGMIHVLSGRDQFAKGFRYKYLD